MEKKGAIKLIDLDKSYGDNHVVDHINFSVEKGEFVSFLGPSGCGKTTLLRMIAGFETLDGGDIRLDGESIIKLPPEKRNVHTVFQHYSLFPHMNVYDNIAYGLKAEHVGRSKIQEAVKEALKIVSLEGFEERMPSQMSGGQKQRVAIARAIVTHPSVLLLDEPLTALDMKLRKDMRYKLREIQQQLGITFIYVTHDQEEAMIMSDKIVVLQSGHIEQQGIPQELYKNPKTAFVSDFIGETNEFDGMVGDPKGDAIRILCESGDFLATGFSFEKDEFVNVSIRPHRVQWSEEKVPGFHLHGHVTDFIYTGSLVTAVVMLRNGRRVRVSQLGGRGLPKLNQIVHLFWDPKYAIVMKNPVGDVAKMTGMVKFPEKI